MYAKPTIVTRSLNHCCSGKSIFCVNVSIPALHIWREKLMRRNNLWTVRLYRIFPLYLLKGTIFVKIIESEMCILILSKNLCEINSKNKSARYYLTCT